jgi:hypothetical protein
MGEKLVCLRLYRYDREPNEPKRREGRAKGKFTCQKAGKSQAFVLLYGLVPAAF